MGRLGGFLAFSMLLTGCSFSVTRDIRASLQDARTGVIESMSIKTEGAPRSGTFTGVRADGEIFNGHYTALVGGVNYGPTYDISKQGEVSNANANVTMMGVSSKGTSLRCDLISSRSLYDPHGTGTCTDSRGRSYNVMF